jgi:hypothetical protein
MTIYTKAGGILVAALLFGAGPGAPSDAMAQTATNLVCKGCVGAKDIGKKSVRTKTIKPKAIRSKHVAKEQITQGHLDSTAKPAGLDFAEATAAKLLTTSEVVASTIVSAPGPGSILAIGSAVTLVAAGESIVCGVSTGETVDTIFNAGSATSEQNLPLTTSRVLPVDAAGDVTVNLVCLPGLGTPTVGSVSLTALFVPGSY